MVEEAFLQILQILAYLAIGLLSVTFPIYAICVTYLRQEKTEIEKERKTHIDVLKQRIANLTKQLSGQQKDSESFIQINEQIRQCRKELAKCEKRVRLLTARGAVRDPAICLAIALSLSAIGIFILYVELEQYLHIVSFFVFSICSALSSGLAIFYLYGAITTIEHAALRAERAIDFFVNFGELGEKSQEIKCGVEASLNIGTGTDDEDLENLVLQIFFPLEIELKKTPYDRKPTLQTKGFAFPNHNMIAIERDFASKGTSYTARFIVLATKKGDFKIPIQVSAKGTKRWEETLSLRVTE